MLAYDSMVSSLNSGRRMAYQLKNGYLWLSFVCLTYIVITSSSVLLLIPRRDYFGVSYGLWELYLQCILFEFWLMRPGGVFLVGENL